MKKIIILVLLGFIGAQTNAAVIEVVNKAKKSSIGVLLFLKGVTVKDKLGYLIPPEDSTKEIKEGLAGYTKVQWTSCGRIYEGNFDIEGTDPGKHIIEIDGSKATHKNWAGLDLGMTINMVKDTPCEKELR